jgi:hypothetical protein
MEQVQRRGGLSSLEMVTLYLMLPQWQAAL